MFRTDDRLNKQTNKQTMMGTFLLKSPLNMGMGSEASAAPPEVGQNTMGLHTFQKECFSGLCLLLLKHVRYKIMSNVPNIVFLTHLNIHPSIYHVGGHIFQLPQASMLKLPKSSLS